MKTITMKPLSRVFLAAILVGACSSGAPAASVSPPTALVSPSEPARAEVASAVIPHLRVLVATGRVRGIGLSSPEELDRATLGEAIPVYFVHGTDLTGLPPGADPHGVLGEPREMLYPVLVDGVAKSAVVMSRNGAGEWKVTGIGRRKLIDSLGRTSRMLAGTGHASPLALVTMHDVGVSMAAREENGKVMFAALAEAGSGDLPVDQDLPAGAAFPGRRAILR
jgi:hypothetical protein